MVFEDQHVVIPREVQDDSARPTGGGLQITHPESQQESGQFVTQAIHDHMPKAQLESGNERMTSNASHGAVATNEVKPHQPDSSPLTEASSYIDKIENNPNANRGEIATPLQGDERPESPEFEFQDSHIPLDVDSDETDSAMGDMIASSTVSINSSLYNPIWEYGRSYHRHRSGRYMLPNDETEQARLDLQHHIWVMSLHGALHLAPIRKDSHEVLDIATGTGIWATEFAMVYPSATVIGTDLSPIQPQFIPPNCRFEVDDAEDDWIYSHKFDYIHGRMLISCFKDFPAIVRKSFDALQPGGYFELQDICPVSCFDDSWNGSELQRWRNLVTTAAASLGMDWLKATKYKQFMIDAGFEDVREVELAWPINTWPRGKHYKLLGAWNHQNYTDGIHGFTMRVLTKGLGMTAQEVEELLVGAKNCLKDKKIHCYSPVYVVYGRKPF